MSAWGERMMAQEGGAGTASGECRYLPHVCAAPETKGGEPLSAGRFGWDCGRGLAPGERRRARGHWRMALVVVLVRAGQRERGAFT